MRSEKEIMKLIIDAAKGDSRIRAVIMNGSRANPNAPKDIFQDYDIVYIVNEMDSFISNHDWINIFGKRIFLQMPELMREPIGDGRFTYLMLFTDGNRIDLQLIPLEKYEQLIKNDSESILLLDKDNIFLPFPPASDIDYYIKKPTENDFSSCCNNFWWCMQNVAKGIWRDELPYAMYMLNVVVRDDLHSMIEWYIGINTNFLVSSGKCGKYFSKYLGQETWQKYIKTYADSNYENIWTSVFMSCDLFKELENYVADYFGYKSYTKEEKSIFKYFKHIKDLPQDAKEIY